MISDLPPEVLEVGIMYNDCHVVFTVSFSLSYSRIAVKFISDIIWAAYCIFFGFDLFWYGFVKRLLRMPTDLVLKQNINYIKEWMSKEPHLPTDLDDVVIRKFLHSCYGNFEKTKKCIDRFCCTRSQMSEIFTLRDPFSPKLKTAFSVMVRSTFICGKTELIVNKFNDPTMEKFSFYDMLKGICMTVDYWIQFHPFLAEEHIIVLDLEYYSLKMIPKINLIVFRDFIIFMLQALPVRVTKIIGVNSPSFYEKLYAFVKPMLPSAVCDIIHFYPDHEGLYKYIDRKYLPVEYGGEAESTLEKNEQWFKDLDRERKMFLNDDLWKADLKKKRKNNTKDDSNVMNGSFKSLAID